MSLRNLQAQVEKKATLYYAVMYFILEAINYYYFGFSYSTNLNILIFA